MPLDGADALLAVAELPTPRPPLRGVSLPTRPVSPPPATTGSTSTCAPPAFFDVDAMFRELAFAVQITSAALSSTPRNSLRLSFDECRHSSVELSSVGTSSYVCQRQQARRSQSNCHSIRQLLVLATTELEKGSVLVVLKKTKRCLVCSSSGFQTHSGDDAECGDPITLTCT